MSIKPQQNQYAVVSSVCFYDIYLSFITICASTFTLIVHIRWRASKQCNDDDKILVLRGTTTTIEQIY